MDPRLTDIAETLAKDTNSGASEMMSAVLNSLLAIPEEELAAIPGSEWEDFATALHEGKPTIAPIFNVANIIMLEVEHGLHGRALHNVFLQAAEEERRSGARIAEQAVKHIKGTWFMTTSYSGTVAHVVRAISKDRGIKVTVAESLPGGEGRQFAQLLAQHQIDTEIIYDSTIFARMEEMDGAIVGSDSVTPAGLVNKVGTRAVAEAARAYYVPTFAVCSWSKISPVVLSDLVVKRSELAPRISEHVQVFESSPLELFSHIITDRGMLTSADLKMELKVRKVARAWYARGVLKRPDVISAR